MKVKIESGIPIPQRGRNKFDIEIDWSEMKNGDSFFIPFDIKDKKGVSSLNMFIRSRLDKYTQSLAPGREVLQKITSRMVSGGIRFWLIEYTREDYEK